MQNRKWTDGRNISGTKSSLLNAYIYIVVRNEML